MSALLGNPMVVTAALPFVLGLLLGVAARLAVVRTPAVGVLLWGVVVLFLYWDTLGPPVFPPVAASQKLIFLGIAGIVIGLAAGMLGSRRLGALVAAALVAGFLWLGWRRLTGGAIDSVVGVAIVVAILAAIGAFLLLAAPAAAGGGVERPFLRPAAVLAMSFAGAIISVLGASIVVGQFLGSLAALTGGYCLFLYLATLAGRSVDGWSQGITALVLFAAATALLQTALLAPKANPVALLIAPLSLFGPRLVAGPLRSFLPDAQPLRPLVAGVLAAIPAILAVLAAIIWAPEGAALGFS